MADIERDEKGYPIVHDDAPDTPMWVPTLGLVLLGILSLFMVYRFAAADMENANSAEADSAGAELQVVEDAPTPE